MKPNDEQQLLAKELFEICHYPSPDKFEDQDVHTQERWIYNVEIFMDKINRHPSPRAGCKLAGKDRGDCEHFIGVPEVLNDKTTDCYGVPNGWCDYCWLAYRLENQSPRAGLSVKRIKNILIKHGVQSLRSTHTEIANAIHSAQPSDRTVGR